MSDDGAVSVVTGTATQQQKNHTHSKRAGNEKKHFDRNPEKERAHAIVLLEYTDEKRTQRTPLNVHRNRNKSTFYLMQNKKNLKKNSLTNIL